MKRLILQSIAAALLLSSLSACIILPEGGGYHRPYYGRYYR